MGACAASTYIWFRFICCSLAKLCACLISNHSCKLCIYLIIIDEILLAREIPGSSGFLKSSSRRSHIHSTVLCRWLWQLWVWWVYPRAAKAGNQGEAKKVKFPHSLPGTSRNPYPKATPGVSSTILSNAMAAAKASHLRNLNKAKIEAKEWISKQKNTNKNNNLNYKL